MIKLGQPAIDFALEGTVPEGSDDGCDGGSREYKLSEFRGQPVVLVFYPGDNTPVCTKQLTAYTDEIDAFREVGAQVLAISPQSVQSHDEFSCSQGGFGFPLLADTDKSVGGAYGVLGPLGFYRRSVFVVDGEGIVRYIHRSLTGITFKPTAELVAAVRKAADRS